MLKSNRREVFTSLFGKRTETKKSVVCVRPPYQNEGYEFLDVCVTCQDTPCVNACEENIIALDAHQTPCLDFTKGGCTFCEACARACPTEMLSLEAPSTLNATVSIDILTCMAWHNSLCNSCLDACQVRAIQFLGLFRPQIDAQACTGCGWCINVCPTQAMRIHWKEA